MTEYHIFRNISSKRYLGKIETTSKKKALEIAKERFEKEMDINSNICCRCSGKIGIIKVESVECKEYKEKK